MIKKISETTPTMASMVNSHSNSTTNGYSCDYINDNYQEKCTVLWTNSNPTSDFSAQDININLTSYDYIVIECKHYKSTNSYMYQRFNIPSEDMKLFYANDSECEARNVTITSTKISFGNGRKMGWNNVGSWGDENARLVPVHIYGYYKEYKY